MEDLLLEADRKAFSTELDVRAVDPTSLEPCCPRSFYPLLEETSCWSRQGLEGCNKLKVLKRT